MPNQPVPAALPLPIGGPARPADRLAEAAVEFEALFLSQMLRATIGGLGSEGPFGKEPFASLLVDEYARLIAKSGGIGIADATRRELLRLQEARP